MFNRKFKIRNQLRLDTKENEAKTLREQLQLALVCNASEFFLMKVY